MTPDTIIALVIQVIAVVAANGFVVMAAALRYESRITRIETKLDVIAGGGKLPPMGD